MAGVDPAPRPRAGSVQGAARPPAGIRSAFCRSPPRSPLGGSGGGRVPGARNSQLFKILLEPFLIPPCAGEGRARAGRGEEEEGGEGAGGGGGGGEEGAARPAPACPSRRGGAWPRARPANGLCVWRRRHGDGAVPGEAVMG